MKITTFFGRDQDPSATDIILDILCRIPPLDFDATCRSAWKEWISNNIIHKSSFIRTLYCRRRTKNLSGYFIQAHKQKTFPSTFIPFNHDDRSSSSKKYVSSVPNDSKILASCNHGLLFCRRRIKSGQYRCYVCKPMTGQWQALPNPKLRYRDAANAIVVMPSVGSAPDNYLRYKIIRLSYRGVIDCRCKVSGCMEKYYKYGCEVFDSKFWMWEELEKDMMLPYGELILPLDPGVSVGNTVHWRTSNHNILAFDSKDYSFSKFSIPEDVWKNNLYNCNQLLDCDGKLGIAHLPWDGCVELWILGDRKPKEWTRKMTYSLEHLEAHAARFPSLENSDIALMKGLEEVLFRRLQSTSYRIEDREKPDMEKLNELRSIFLFRSDFKPVNLHCRPRFPRFTKSREKILICLDLSIISCLVMAFCLFISYFSLLIRW